MNQEIWRSVSTGFLIAGIIFLLITVILSIKFQLVSIIKSEINMRKEKQLPEETYFSYENKTEIPEKSFSDNISYDKNTATVPSFYEDKNITETIVKPYPEQTGGETVLVSSQKNNDSISENTDKKDFEILENIIIINGNPDAIIRRRSF